MSTSYSHTPKIVQLASCLEKDIQEKGLRSGDPYVSTAEAARMLGVSTVSANRALQLLVKRDVLRRRQGSGTFVAEPRQQTDGIQMDRIHMLVHQNFLKTEGLLADGVILGIQEKLPQAEIQFNFLPTNNEGDYVNRVITETLKSNRSEGYVMVRAPLEVQRIVQASGLPAVIYGTPFPSINAIPWIDRDQYQMGRLAAARMIRAGFRELTLISRERTMPGDYLTLDGVRDEMTTAGLPLRALLWRAVPADTEAARYAVLELLRTDRQMQGFICRSRPLADGAAEGIAQMQMKIGRDAGVVLLDVFQSKAPPFPYLSSAMHPDDIGKHIGQMLSVLAQGAKPRPDHEIVPMELREPKAAGV